MIFGHLPLHEAAGAVLAHTQRLPDRVLKKGAVLDAAALDALRAGGVEAVVAAKLEPGDVGENEAADRLAAALLAPDPRADSRAGSRASGLRATRGATGRVNLIAEVPGLLRVDAVAVDTLNAVDEALTVATLPDYAPVAAREMVATVKVIPFAVPGALLRRVEEAARAGPAPLVLHPFRPLRVGLVLTELPGLKESVLEGTVEATAARVAGLTGGLLPALHCPHAEAPIARALEVLVGQGAEVLLVAGASAVVDRRDVGPAGIVAAGGEILHFGMPVDPGNLICLGRIGARPALVLPGCARSPKLNGIDWVLARLFAGLPVDGAAISRMGVGGLLKDVGARPLPRAKAAKDAAAAATPDAGSDAGSVPAPAGPRVAAVVLAAGRSTRMAPRNKLLIADRTGKPLVARAVDAALSSQARPVLVVTGHRGDEVARALGGRPVRVVPAPDYAEGLSASLRAGIAAVPPECTAALVCLGDMPLVAGRHLDRLIEAYDPDEGRTIVVPTSKGRVGNPVLWDRRFFPDILALTGDVGARALLQRHAESVTEVELGDDAVLRDFDTAQSLAELPAHLRPVDAL